MMDRDAWLARWTSEPTREVAEALERIAEETDERIDGYGLVSWLRVLDPKAAPVVEGTRVETVEVPMDDRVKSALAAFGPAALPGLCRAARGAQYRSKDAAALLAEIAAHVPFVGDALWETTHHEAIAACVRAGGIARERLVLPADHERTLESRLVKVLVRLGAPYAEELGLLVARTQLRTHDEVAWELDRLHRGKLAPELLPVLAKLIARDDGGPSAKAIWVACSLRARAAPLLDELLAAMQSEDFETRRAAASTLAYLDEIPAERGLPILEPLLEPGLSIRAQREDRGPADPRVLDQVIEAIGAIRPPPMHLAARFEAELRRVAAEGMSGLRGEALARALGRMAPDRAIAILEGIEDLRASRRLVFALLDSGGLPDEVMLAWVVRLLDAGLGPIKHASMLSDKRAWPQLVAPLVRVHASGTDVTHILAKHDRALVLRELSPQIASPDGVVRGRALQLLIALSHGAGIARYLADPDAVLARRAARWLILHGGAQLLPELAREASCAE